MSARTRPTPELLRQLTERVMRDSGGRFSDLDACLFVAGMFPGYSGWLVLMEVESAIRAEAKAMYAEKAP